MIGDDSRKLGVDVSDDAEAAAEVDVEVGVAVAVAVGAIFDALSSPFGSDSGFKRIHGLIIYPSLHL